ncbi:hypothetical protein AB0C40_01755 [Streptomyces brevispora]|uniref:hypothetical protein n=1 Tax=Streptomyces brevispora TaxID=887462 RepID=UPI0033EBF459
MGLPAGHGERPAATPQKAGVFDRLHRVLLAELNAAGGLDRSRHRPDALLGDKGDDSHSNRDALRERRILPVISRKRAQRSQWGSGRHIAPLGRAETRPSRRAPRLGQPGLTASVAK